MLLILPAIMGGSIGSWIAMYVFRHKTKCHKCSVHCYMPEMRERIKEVMRYSGPRMLLHHPVEAMIFLINK